MGGRFLGSALVVALFAFGCGGSGPQVSGVATFVNGASTVTREGVETAPRLASRGRPSAGFYAITPDQLTLTLTKISLIAASGENADAALSGCTATFDKTKAGLTKLSECTFSVSAGTYYGLILYVNSTVGIKINDSTSNFYTTSTSATGLSTTPVTAETVNVTYTGSPAYGADGFASTTVFASPLVVTEGTAVALSVVVDGIHAIRAEVAARGVASFQTDGATAGHPDYVGSIGTVGKVAYYLPTSFGAFTQSVSYTGATSLKVFYSDVDNPVFLFGLVTASSMLVACTPGSYGLGGVNNVNHANFTLNTSNTGSSSKYGGYLGLDITTMSPSRVLAWAEPTDSTFTTFQGFYEMAEAAAIGDATSLKCKKTTAPPVPTSGNTYTSGAPSLPTADGTLPMTLRAK